MNTITLISTYWYEIIYSDDLKIIFQFLDTTSDGQIRCKLCDGQETLNIFHGSQMKIVEHGEKCPCEQ